MKRRMFLRSILALSIVPVVPVKALLAESSFPVYEQMIAVGGHGNFHNGEFRIYNDYPREPIGTLVFRTGEIIAVNGAGTFEKMIICSSGRVLWRIKVDPAICPEVEAWHKRISP